MGCVGSKASPTAAHAVNLAQNDLEELPAIPIDTEKLDCSENKLKALPITIMDLVHLKELDANSNQLTAVPEGIIGCVALEVRGIALVACGPEPYAISSSDD